VETILTRERPNVIESGDPYQLGWRAVKIGQALRVPVIGFYHSHFPEAYLRRSARLLGKTATRRVMRLSRAYVRKLYNQHAATLVASERLPRVLRDWDVRNVRVLSLGVNTDIFRPGKSGADAARRSLGIDSNRTLLLYVGRLAKEKNTATLFRAFEILERWRPSQFHLLVIGDGPERTQLQKLRSRNEHVSWVRYCADPCELSRFYRAADLFVHPGAQETFGLVALESQACGTPVVGIRGSAMDELIFHDQENWAHENSAAALARAIELFSRKDLSSLGQEAAAKTAQLHAWPRVFERLFCIYREVCANYKGHSAR
jgi:alpha-1,6-mannosyltransferase